MTKRNVLIKFIPGLKLSEDFFKTLVAQMMERKFPELIYSAAKIDQGSDVLGYDTEMSMDHHWGPKTMIFLGEEDYKEYRDALADYFSYSLPFEFKGYPTHFDNVEDSGGVLKKIAKYPITHGISVHTIQGFFKNYLGFDPEKKITEVDWLTVPNQNLLTISKGRIFHDGLGRLGPIRKKLAWYPDDVWYFLLACQWRKIAQEEPFMARCGIAGDELGSRLVAGRMVNEIMKLCFMMEKRYYPYYKWFGTAFNQLNCAGDIGPVLKRVFNCSDWKEREKFLSAAYERLAKMHNQLKLTGKLPAKVSSFHDRPIKVIQSDAFADELFKRIRSKKLRSIPRKVGAINQFVDSTDVLCWTEGLGKISKIYNVDSQ